MLALHHMKIALIGAQGVGKTTLCQRLVKELPGAYLVRETVRECPYPCDKDADFKTEWWVLSHSILAEQEAREQKPELIITDRCLLDIAIYTKLLHESKNGKISNIQRKMIESSIQEWLMEDPYDVIFFMKVNPEIWKTRDIDDGFRSVDMGWYKILTAEFEKALLRFAFPDQTKIIHIENDESVEKATGTIITEIRSPRLASRESAGESSSLRHAD